MGGWGGPRQQGTSCLEVLGAAVEPVAWVAGSWLCCCSADWVGWRAA
jgi:hypothetical protein